MNRIKRIVGIDHRRRRRGGMITAVLVAIVCLAVAGFDSTAARSSDEKPDLAAIRARLQAMVEAGALSAGEAHAMMVSPRRKAASRR